MAFMDSVDDRRSLLRCNRHSSEQNCFDSGGT